jgi:hypothetical protein
MTNEQQQSPKFCLDKLKKHLYNTIWGIKQLLTMNWPLCAPSNCYPSPVKKMARRTRFQANSMMLNRSVDVHGRKKACTVPVHTALTKRDDTFLTIVEDMLPTAVGSQDILNACLTQALLEQTK